MSAEYDAYIREHTSNVLKAADWLETNIPELNVMVYAFHNLLHHDESKWKDDEYQAYDAYFYGNDRYFTVKAGDLGGFVEKEENLDDNAWVYDDAMVYDNARVSETAVVYCSKI